MICWFMQNHVELNFILFTIVNKFCLQQVMYSVVQPVFLKGFNHGLPCYVENMALGPQSRQKTSAVDYSLLLLWFNWSFSTKISEIVEWECCGQPQNWLLGKAGCCYAWVAKQHTWIESSLYIYRCDIVVAKEQQWLLGKYLINALLLG